MVTEGGRTGAMTRAVARGEAAVRDLARTQEGNELGVVRLAELVGGLIREGETGVEGRRESTESSSSMESTDPDALLQDMVDTELQVRYGGSFSQTDSECEVCTSLDETDETMADEAIAKPGRVEGTHSGMTGERP